MSAFSLLKVYFALIVAVGLGLTSLAENEAENRLKYKYGYVIAHKGGGTQAHLESRDGNLALGRYYVNLQNGTGQKVTYFADDQGFHTGVSYSSQNGKGSSKTEIAMGQNALAAFGNSESQQKAVTARSSTLLFGKKILKTAINAVTPKHGSYPKLNYTPVPGGFYLTHDSAETSNETTEHPSNVAGLTSQAFFPYKGKYSEGVPQSKANTQTFYPTSENVKNKINQLHIQSTTPSIKSYISVPQQGFIFPGPRDETTQFSQKDETVKVSTYATNFDGLSYSNEKSIEKTNFADIDAQIISEVQKHAEEIILKDLQKNKNVNLENEFTRFSSGTYQPSTVTMQPIVVTNNGEIGLKTIISTTAIPEVRKLGKTLQLDTINSVKIKEKNSDQALEDSGYFRVSLSPSLVSSINVSQTPHQSINAESTDLNSVSNNSTFCEFNLCQKDRKEIFSIDLSEVKPNKEIVGSGSAVSDISAGSGTNKIIHTFYPENKLHDERHYITTIDVQKAISLDVNQNEAGTIKLAQNFPFNKIKPFSQLQNQNNEQPTPQPFISNQISVTPNSFGLESHSNSVSTSQTPYILNTVTAAPGLFDATPNQNLGVLQGLNEISSNQVQYGPILQDRIGSRLGYENQLVVPPPPVLLTNEAADEYRQKQTEELNQVEKNIQELRQQILSIIDDQHEEEQRKQHLVDEERKQYFENLKKVEALKGQNSVSYHVPVNSEANIIQRTSSSSSAENIKNVELVPQAQYLSAPQPQFEPAQQTEYAPASQTQYVSAPQLQYEAVTQTQFEPGPQTQYVSPPQTQYETAPQTQYDAEPQAEYAPQRPQTYQTEIKDFTHEVAVPETNIEQIPNAGIHEKHILSYSPQNIQNTNTAQQYSLYASRNVYAIDNNIQQSAPVYTTEKIQLNNYVPQITYQRYAAEQVAQTQDKPENGQQQLAVLNSQLSAVPVSLPTEVLPQTKVPEPKALLLNRVLPLDYSRILQVKQPVSLLQTYSVPLATETKLPVPEIYPIAQQIALPVSIPQAYKLVPYPDVTPVTNKQYHSTLTHKQNKLRVQPLKPSSPDEDTQRATVQNLLSQSQFHQTYYYPELTYNNRLQLRHIRKNQISNSDQVRSQSVIRRGKSLKNLRIEYGFKPPLRPSVEFSEEVKPSIYGPSVQPH